MPTLSPEPASRSDRELHHDRKAAESFGTEAERYDRVRPRYPREMVERIAAAGPGPRVLDVGCGTGIAARQFQAAGCEVLGVDPDARMAELARRYGVEAEVARFEDWEPRGRVFDAVIAAQAWHWVDPVAGAAKAARVLRPGGRLALFWNVGQPQAGATEAFAEVYRRVIPGFPINAPERSAMDAYSAFFDKAADGLRRTGAFGEIEQWHYGWDHHYTRDEWLDVLPTQGVFTTLPEETLREVVTSFGAAVDALGGGFTMHYTAVAVTTTRRGSHMRTSDD